MEIKTNKDLIKRIEYFGMIKWGNGRGYIKLNDKQWELIKSECSSKKYMENPKCSICGKEMKNKMVTFDIEKQKEAHKILHKAIYDCECKPWRKRETYCSKCHANVIMFMDTYGAGVLTRDIELDELLKKYSKLLKTNSAINKRLESKVKRVEELKKLLDSPKK